MSLHNVLIGQHCFNELLPHIHGNQVAIISNASIAQHYEPSLKSLLKDRQVTTVLIPEGEAYKNWGSVQAIIDVLIANQFNRQCTLIGLGGGVVTDITGFTASIYLRGVSVVQIPTTLLAQVDASVGGKTAINHPQGKNLIGTFYQPTVSIIDIETLNTLPDIHFKAGLAEVVKAALICDATFFEWLEAHVTDILNRQPQALLHMIRRAVEIKQAIVDEDFKECGKRRLLNLGHTFGHALEACSGFTLLHGHAVSIGMVMAAEVSLKQNRLSRIDCDRIKSLLQAFGLPTQADVKHEGWEAYLTQDKKMDDQGLRYILLDAIGQAVVIRL